MMYQNNSQLTIRPVFLVINPLVEMTLHDNNIHQAFALRIPGKSKVEQLISTVGIPYDKVLKNRI